MEERNLSREYIARDPRTGLPIAVAKRRKSEKKIKVEKGPWVALSDEEVFSLLQGEISTASGNVKVCYIKYYFPQTLLS